VCGLIVLPLLVLLAFRNQSLLLTCLAAATAAYLAISVFHSWTLVYGRALLSMSMVFGLLTVISLTPLLPFENGLLPFLTGILGGVGAYNIQVTPPAERRSAVVVTTGAFVVLAAVARLLVTPLEAGILNEIGPLHVLGAGFVLALMGWEAYRFERVRPAESDRHDAMWDVDEREEVTL